MRKVMRYVLVAAVIAALGMPVSGNSLAVTSPTATAAVASVQPRRGEVVGVAAPVTVTFTRPIRDRAAAERTIDIASPPKMAGRFVWLDDHVVQWNPNTFWPAHSRITVRANGAPTQFESGAAVVGVADISEHTFTVSIDGQVARAMPASMGKPSRPTPIGNFSVLEKDRTVVMDFGAKLCEGAPAEIRRDPRVQEAYLGGVA